MTEDKAHELNIETAAKLDDPTSPSSSPAETTAPDGEPSAVEAPPPEPLTPERAAAENRRNDLFIVAAVLVVAFLLGSVKIREADLWLHLKAGWQIDQQGVPSYDSFAYTSNEKPWVNLNWMYDWALYQSEVVEARTQVRRLATDYQKLLAVRLAPKLNDEGRDVTDPLPDDKRQELESAIARLASTAETADTDQMRLAAEQAAETAKGAGLRLPLASQESEQTNYPALTRYTSPGGKSLINLAVPVVIKSLMLVALAGVLLLMRQAGQTLWWTAVVSGVALVAMSDRMGLTPEIPSLFFLATVFWILQQHESGCRWAIWLLVPLELAWVNIDGLFVLGLGVPLIVLLCEAVGKFVRRAPISESMQPSQARTGVMVAAIAISFVATLANPFGLRAWGEMLDWTQTMLGRLPLVTAGFLRLCGSDSEWTNGVLSRGDYLFTLMPDLVSPLSRSFVTAFLFDPPIPLLTALVLMLLALLSFIPNWRRLRVSRLIVLLFFIAMYLLAYRYVALASLVAGVTLALNGQDWFLRRFGTETRITRGWLIWSQGGRAVTVLALALVAFFGITGWIGAERASEFGFGIQWIRFDLGTGEFLRQANLKGQPLNTVPLQGNLLVWSNYPQSKVFIDSRAMLHRERMTDFEAMKKSMRDEDDKTWQPLLDKHNISHVILNLSGLADRVTFFNTYKKLQLSDAWKLVYFGPSSAIFGRTDVPEDHPLAGDAQWFNLHPFDPARLVFKENAERLPDPPPPVRAPTAIDRIWRTRRIPTSEAILAGYFLNPRLVAANPSGMPFIVPPENCFLAIRAARQGLSKQQGVSPQGYAALTEAYFYLFNMELAQAPNPETHEFRLLQLLSSLNQRVAANPNDLSGQIQLAFRFLRMQFWDLANEHLEAAIELMPEESAFEIMFEGGDLRKFTKTDLIGISEDRKIEIERVKNDLNQLAAQVPSPIAKANYLMRRGCPGLAIQELTESAALSMSGMDLAPTLANLYIRIGQAGDLDRGAEREMRNLRPSGQMRPGMTEEMWATVKLMQGDYDHARSFLEDAIAVTRHAMAKESLQSATGNLREGGLLTMAVTPTTFVEDADRQARMEFHLGLLQLEAGEPIEAARHFKQALTVREDMDFRMVIAFYLERITGEKLEPLPEPPKEQSTGGGVSDASTAPPGPVSPKPGSAKPVAPSTPPGETPKSESAK